ncbi:HRDC domain-containing protein [Alistipes sp.]|uniref:HRDC domain-containing protein n=1 Tax=Alistipes sp. TaxID=1872444 RepID=UPI003AB2C356
MASDNPQLDLAWKFLEQTGANIFLTGRAGTGKTTFLRELRQRSPKRMIVVAPTGVAAINAGGVTVHSFFQLPFGPYIPAMQQGEGGRLKMNFNREKIAIIRSLDLLVIDEISMVRADMLDAVNDVLQRYRDRSKPFGGVQLLMIGDLQQLAPVVKPQEWELIRDHYASPYFFDSRALRSTTYITLELRHIYRQSDGGFIDILNRVRDNAVDPDTLAKLNSRYIAGFEPDDEAGYITLTSHNDTARAINERKLRSLDAPSFTFPCQVEGNFPEYLYPNDSELTLKKGAQVMFVKNDVSGQHRYFNGKIGRVTAIGESKIEVTLDDAAEPVDVGIDEWTNVKYTIDPQTQEITEAVEGVFRQFPLKPAWAITIHKSQGLTFERAIIDAAESFSHGQVYVALSRCRSFEGLVLRTPLQGRSIIDDATIRAFNKNLEENQPDETVLSAQRRQYYRSLLFDMFDFVPLRIRLLVVRKVLGEHLGRLYPKLTEAWNDMLDRFAAEIVAVSERFQTQLDDILASAPDAERNPRLTERITKAQAYFLARCRELVEPVVEQSDVVVDNKEVRKQLTGALKKLREVLAVKLAVLGMDNSGGFTIHNYLDTRAKATLDEPKAKPAKGAKGSKREKTVEEEHSGDVENAGLFALLRVWRRETAAREHVPAYVVMHQAALLAVCRALPRSGRELSGIKGIGKVFVAKYGEEVLAIVRDWVATENINSR